jgi:WD40 repeat protein
MDSYTRPRLDEFLLALLWLLSSCVWAYFGVIGFIINFKDFPDISLPGTILSYFFVCLAAFGWSFAISVFWRIPKNPPLWIQNYGSIFRAVLLIAGFFFSLFTMVLMIIDLISYENDRLIFGWGFAASVGLFVLGIYMLLVAMCILEPFLFLIEFEVEGAPKTKTHPLLFWLVGLNNLQRALFGTNKRKGDRLQGPLITETDLKTTLEERKDYRPALEKMLIAHGGWHVQTMGFTANGSVIFAASTGGIPHFQAGGRKGLMFPPEIKFWEWQSGKVQTALLGKTQTFLTRDYNIPPSLNKYKFLVPNGGGKFAWANPKTIIVGDWQSDQVQELSQEEGFLLEGKNGFTPVAFNSEGSKIAWCDATGQTRYWDLENDRVHPLRMYPASPETTNELNLVWGLMFSPDGTKIATIAERGILLQNVYTGWRWFAESNPNSEKITAFAFDYNGLQMAVGMMVAPKAAYSFEKAEAKAFLSVIRLWDLRVADYIDLISGIKPIREVTFSPDNKMLVAVDEAGILRLWDIIPDNSLNQSPRQIVQLDLGITGRKTVVSFSADMLQLVSATDNRILVWDLAKLRQEYPFVEIQRRNGQQVS